MKNNREKPHSQKNNTTLTKSEKIEKLPWTIAYVATNSIAVHLTFIGSIFILYLNELGINKGLLGVILSLLPFINILSIFVAPKINEFGVRKVFIISFTIRYLIWLPIIFSPWVRNQYGENAMVLLLISIVIIFAFFRMVNLVAILPWKQEIIPESIRGIVSAKQMVFANIANIVTVTLAAIYIEHSQGIRPFNVLFVLGVIIGLIAAWEASHFPGGAPKRRDKLKDSILHQIFSPLKDHDFRKYMHGTGWIILAESLFPYVVLYMREGIGLSAGNVVLLQTGSLVGGAVTSYLWGWAADRFGSKPILHVNTVLFAILPILWFVMPYQSPLSVTIAMAIAFLQGAAQMGRFIGNSRLLYNRIVPIKSSAAYMALYNAWLGLIMGGSQLLGGALLNAISDLSGSLWRFPINEYSVLFGFIFLFSILGIIVTTFIETKDEISMGEFVGMFFRGNPLLAFETLISFQRPKTERDTISLTERIGRAQSDLTIDELQSSLNDPRFYVRYEALISIARHHPHPQLTKSLINILNGKDPALSVISAWALGRIDDPTAHYALRNALISSEFRSVKAHCARSLGALGDVQSIPILINLFNQETDRGLLQSYAVALGHLGVSSVFDDIVKLLLYKTNNQDQLELALTLGRLMGDEDDFILVNRQLQEDFFTNTAQFLHSFRSSSVLALNPNILKICETAFANKNLKKAVEELSKLSLQATQDLRSNHIHRLVKEFSNYLLTIKYVRKDLILLLIFILYALNERKID